MENKIYQVRKRDKKIVEFDKQKITNAIFKAIQSIGENNYKLAEELSNKVVETLKSQTPPGTIPTVEEIQDIVEKTLIEEGYAKIAKSYILYRQKRAEIRREKMKILEKEKIDEIDKQFDITALRILKSRYLRKDEKGKLIEGPKELFTRVAIHVGLPELLYDSAIYSKDGGYPHYPEEEFDPKEFENAIFIGKYQLNRYHLEALKRMYDRFNQQGKMKMNWGQFFHLLKVGKFNKYEESIDKFFDIMVSKKFLPNTPALANFGNALGMGSACFALEIEDSMEKIMDALKEAAIVFKAGGGMGYNFSKLRPEGDFVSTTSGIASGPISFMRLFDVMTEVIKQGGIRRGANMGILNINHPDIEKFISVKSGNKILKNFNISVLILPDFWEYYEKNQPYPLVNPRNGEVVRTVNPRTLFEIIAYQAWESAEPGIIFYDHVNAYNPFFHTLGPIVTTNPCGEVLLYSNESCNLGSINVWQFVKEDNEGKTSVDWEKLKETIRISTRFLDNVIEVNKLPLKSIEEKTLLTRKIGLGIMGLADLLLELKLGYDTEEGRNFAERIAEFVNYYSKIESIELAKERGPFPYYEKSFYKDGKLPFSGFENSDDWHLDWKKVVEEIKKYGIRNAYTTVIAPTGSLSMICGCSSGIEPVYSFVYEKHISIGSFYAVDPVFEKVMKKEGIYDEKLIEDTINGYGSIQNIPYIPKKLKKVFVCAHDISAEDHIRMLAQLQKWVDSSISKTINFPSNATVEDVKNAYLLAHKLGCKDVTIFRDTSIPEQVYKVGKKEKEKKIQEKEIQKPQNPPLVPVGVLANTDSTGNSKICPQCKANLEFQEGCAICPDCGWGFCS
jgi:ribonucleoside-diphosphate reductase alpha chain